MWEIRPNLATRAEASLTDPKQFYFRVQQKASLANSRPNLQEDLVWEPPINFLVFEALFTIAQRRLLTLAFVLVTLVDNIVVLTNQVHVLISVAGADLTGLSREAGGKKKHSGQSTGHSGR